MSTATNTVKSSDNSQKEDHIMISQLTAAESGSESADAKLASLGYAPQLRRVSFSQLVLNW